MNSLSTCLVSLTVLLGLSACHDGGGSSNSPSSAQIGHLAISITDAPLDRALVAQASIEVREIKAHTSSSANSGFVVLYSGVPITIDLLALNNGVTQLLIDAPVPVGSYHQVRLVVSDARLELTNGNVYSTANGNLDLTSLDTSGLKIFIQPDIEVVSNLSSTLLLDVDLSKTFHPIPANDPPNAASFQLMPVIKATNLTDTGEIRGRVLMDDGLGGTIGVPDANVYIQPPGDLDPANAIAGTGTLADGSYRVIGLLPGTFDVLATHSVLLGVVPGQVVTVGNATDVDVVIQ
ncbi:MAG TPA: DUF4382 domain-containing protein [Planctomycetota bacterium]|nr:DUF4382 domain-containing protein [Planctomycetota bacterium]